MLRVKKKRSSVGGIWAAVAISNRVDILSTFGPFQRPVYEIDNQVCRVVLSNKPLTSQSFSSIIESMLL